MGEINWTTYDKYDKNVLTWFVNNFRGSAKEINWTAVFKKAYKNDSIKYLVPAFWKYAENDYERKISDQEFFDYYQFKEVYPYMFCKNYWFISMILPNSVTSIDSYAYYACDQFGSITIPNSVKYIGNNAFLECNPQLVITYLGTKAQWRKITLDPEWTGNNYVKIVCTDGEII